MLMKWTFETKYRTYIYTYSVTFFGFPHCMTAQVLFSLDAIITSFPVLPLSFVRICSVSTAL